jgi:hypothetical protein
MPCSEKECVRATSFEVKKPHLTTKLGFTKWGEDKLKNLMKI